MKKESYLELSETGLESPVVQLPIEWRGYEVSYGKIANCPETVDLFESLIFDSDIGTIKSHEFFKKDIQHLICTLDGIYAAELDTIKSVSEFWYKHKKGVMIVGAAMLAVVTAYALSGFSKEGFA